MTLRMVDRLRTALEDEILTGRLAPGTRLDEVALATRFQVSRTPIREALHQLSTSGLIEMRPRRGAIVAPMTAESLIEMFETMAELEAVCGRLASRRMTEDERGSLRVAHERCAPAAEAGDPDAYYRENERFHEVIYAGCHNRFLGEEVRRLRRRLQAYRRLQLRVRNRISASYAEHQMIVEAILAGDDRRTEEALRSHVMIQGERFNDLLTGLATLRRAGA